MHTLRHPLPDQFIFFEHNPLISGTCNILLHATAPGG